jgi:TRAP-type C4-dicarboxylate transport system substrate-binding protein
MHSGLDRGSLDCGINGGDALQTFGLWDVVKSVNLAPLGTYFAGFEWGYNQDFWRGLTAEQRRILLDQMAVALVRTHIAYVAITESVLAEARTRGIAVIEPDATLTDAVQAFAASDVAAAAAIAKEKLGLADPDPVIAEFLAMVEKWDKLLQGVDRTDEAALLAIVKREIYDRIDEASYGLD